MTPAELAAIKEHISRFGCSEVGGFRFDWQQFVLRLVEEVERLRKLEHIARQVAEFKRGGSDVLADDAVDVLCRWCEEHPQ